MRGGGLHAARPVALALALALVVTACSSRVREGSPDVAEETVTSPDVVADGGDVGITPDATPDVDADVLPDASPDADADVVPDASPDAETDAADADAQPDVGVDADADVGPEVEPDALADAEPDVEPDVLPDAAPDVEPDVLPDAAPDPEPDAAPDVAPDAGPDPEPDVAPDVVPDPEPDVAPDVVPDVEPDPEPEVAPDVVPDPEPDAAPDVVPDPEPDVAPDVMPDPEPDVAPDVGPDPEPDVAPDVMPDPEPDVAPDVGPDPEPDVAPDVAPDPEPDVAPDPEPDVAPDPEPDVAPDVTPDGTPDVDTGPDITVGGPLGPNPEPFDDAVWACDAGDAAWVGRAIQAVWGRKPLGLREIEVWTRLVEQTSRADALEAMMRDEAYVLRWADFLMDALRVNRVADKRHDDCYGEPNIGADDGELAAFVREQSPTVTSGMGNFNMTDLLRSSLRLDDISPVYRAHLFALLQKPLTGANVGAQEMEITRRNDFGEVFEATYLYRQKTCMTCHNSEWSITGSDDPELDRTWEIPGYFEAALFKDSFVAELTPEQMRASLRRLGVHTTSISGKKPWGWTSACGRFTPEESITNDSLGVNGYFIEERGLKANLWQLESELRAGFEALRTDGLDLDIETLHVPGDEAFAYLVSVNLANQVWNEIMGSRLTIANFFPRNRSQRDTLWFLTERFIDVGFSMQVLVGDVVLDPRFNQLPPEAGCGGDDGYYMEPTFNPWSPAEEGVLQGNSVGDILVRQGARTMLRSVSSTMDWPQPEAFPSSSDALLHVAIGAFTRDSEPGFRGTDLQGLLAWEDRFGACSSPLPAGTVEGPGCSPTQAPGCSGCSCEDCTCTTDPFCCDTSWDDVCVGICNDSCGGCDVESVPTESGDFIDKLAARILASPGQYTLEEAVVALKDRLIQESAIAVEEAPLLEALLGSPLSAAADEVPELSDGLRSLCGALLESPQYLLFGAYPADWPQAAPALVPAGQDFADFCEDIGPMWDSTMWTVTCDGDDVTVEPYVAPPL